MDREGKYQVKDAAHWSDMFWRRADAFNRALSIVDAPPRMRVSTVAFGGCLALHRELTEQVSFDPWVFRGEDLDYLINARLHGHQVFLDGDWRILHQPPDVPSEALKFRQSGFSFIYGHRKLEFARSQVDLHRITSNSLMPYPGRVPHRLHHLARRGHGLPARCRRGGGRAGRVLQGRPRARLGTPTATPARTATTTSSSSGAGPS